MGTTTIATTNHVPMCVKLRVWVAIYNLDAILDLVIGDVQRWLGELEELFRFCDPRLELRWFLDHFAVYNFEGLLVQLLLEIVRKPRALS